MNENRNRLYQLALDHGWNPADLIRVCREAGMDIRHQLSSLDAEQCRRAIALMRKNDGDEPPLGVTANLK
jgi:hypothetical protein